MKKKNDAEVVNKTGKQRHLFMMVLVFFIVIYSLAYSGIFSTDDEHILAAQALSFAFDDRVNFSRVLGNDRVFSYSRFTDPYADQALNIEPAQAVIGALLAKISVPFGFGRVQTLYLLNIWVTALTTALVFLTAMRMGYSQTIGLVTAAFFGLGTIAFPYSTTYFRDPLAMLFLACAWYFMYSIRQNSGIPKSRSRQALYWLGLALSLAAGILAKNIVLITVPVVILFLLTGQQKKSVSAGNIRSPKKRNLPLWIAVLAVILLGCACWIWIVPKLPVFARFTPAYYSLLLKFFTTTPRPNFLLAVIGPLISPGKSIFIFSPILILSIWSFIFRFKAAWPGWACLMLMILAQAFFYDAEWSGHVNWGLRYLLPTIPPLLLTAVPAVERMLKNIPGKVVLILLAAVSLVIQLLGTFVPISEYYSAMLLGNSPVSEWSTIWEARPSIFVWNALWLASGKPWDLAIFRMPSAIPLLMIAAVVILGGIFLCIKVPRFTRWIWLCLAASLAMNLLMLSSYRKDPAYETGRIDFQKSYAYVSANSQPGEVVLIRSYGTPVWKYWMNRAEPQIHWTALPYFFPSISLLEKYRDTNNPEDALGASSLTILSETAAPGKTLWLILPSDSPGSDLGLEKTWLASRSAAVECSSFSGGEQRTQVCKFVIQS